MGRNWQLEAWCSEVAVGPADTVAQPGQLGPAEGLRRVQLTLGMPKRAGIHRGHREQGTGEQAVPLHASQAHASEGHQTQSGMPVLCHLVADRCVYEPT